MPDAPTDPIILEIDTPFESMLQQASLFLTIFAPLVVTLPEHVVARADHGQVLLRVLDVALGLMVLRILVRFRYQTNPREGTLEYLRCLAGVALRYQMCRLAEVRAWGLSQGWVQPQQGHVAPSRRKQGPVEVFQLAAELPDGRVIPLSDPSPSAAEARALAEELSAYGGQLRASLVGRRPMQLTPGAMPPMQLVGVAFLGPLYVLGDTNLAWWAWLAVLIGIRTFVAALAALPGG